MLEDIQRTALGREVNATIEGPPCDLVLEVETRPESELLKFSLEGFLSPRLAQGSVSVTVKRHRAAEATARSYRRRQRERRLPDQDPVCRACLGRDRLSADCLWPNLNTERNQELTAVRRGSGD